MFHVGQMVECVNDQYIKAPRGVSGMLWDYSLKKGEVYTIRWVGPDAWDGHHTVKLVGVTRSEPAQDRGFFPERFRPLQDSKLEVFRALLANLPAPPKFAPVKEKV